VRLVVIVTLLFFVSLGSAKKDLFFARGTIFVEFVYEKDARDFSSLLR